MLPEEKQSDRASTTFASVCVSVSECEVDKRKSLLVLVRVSDSSVYQQASA